jgi:hypothetical protein
LKRGSARVPRLAPNYFTHKVRLTHYGSLARTVQIFSNQPNFLNTKYWRCGIVFSARKGCETFNIFETMLDSILKECFPKNHFMTFLQLKTWLLLLLFLFLLFFL